MDLILTAIPFFFLLILLELAYGLARKRNTYRLNDTINSLSMGSLSRLQSLVILGVSAGTYELMASRYQLTQLAEDRLAVWLSCFVLYDLVYYWKHRWGHEIALFWGSHVAHHQSEDFNLGTALRQTSVDFYSFLFYLPFFLAGFPAEMLFTVVSLNLIYQFWVHTEHIPKLGALEWILVTPSNHRVHHARNEIYVDRNYGGVFIIWDRLFGSFQQELEREAVIFGLRKPLNSWNPLWANVHVFWRLLQDCVKMPGLTNKLKLWLMPPGWRAPGMRSTCRLGQQAANLSTRTTSDGLAGKFDPPISRRIKIYIFVQFVLTTVIGLYLLVRSNTLSYSLTAFAVLFLGYSYFVHGRWLESRADALRHELVRLLLFAIVMQWLQLSLLLSSSAIGYAVLAMGVAVRLRALQQPAREPPNIEFGNS
jgi:sterol desaturase/sphingolipid hydroxylase (fatty acid hydroxylase superfamily)